MVTYNIEEHWNHYGKASFLHMLDIGDEQCCDCIETHQQQSLNCKWISEFNQWVWWDTKIEERGPKLDIFFYYFVLWRTWYKLWRKSKQNHSSSLGVPIQTKFRSFSSLGTKHRKKKRKENKSKWHCITVILPHCGQWWLVPSLWSSSVVLALFRLFFTDPMT